MKISFTPSAIGDLAAIDAYISARNRIASIATLARIDSAICFLREFPLMGREGRVKGTRELVVPDTSYIVIYEVVDAINLYVLAVSSMAANSFHRNASDLSRATLHSPSADR